MSQSSFCITRRESDSLLKFTGRASVELAIELQRELLATDMNAIAIDWEQSEHIEASVLQVLLACKLNKGCTERELRVERDNPSIREYLKRAGLTDFFSVDPNTETPEGTDA